MGTLHTGTHSISISFAVRSLFALIFFEPHCEWINGNVPLILCRWYLMLKSIGPTSTPSFFWFHHLFSLRVINVHRSTTNKLLPQNMWSTSLISLTLALALSLSLFDFCFCYITINVMFHNIDFVAHQIPIFNWQDAMRNFDLDSIVHVAYERWLLMEISRWFLTSSSSSWSPFSPSFSSLFLLLVGFNKNAAISCQIKWRNGIFMRNTTATTY